MHKYRMILWLKKDLNESPWLVYNPFLQGLIISRIFFLFTWLCLLGVSLARGGGGVG